MRPSDPELSGPEPPPEPPSVAPPPSPNDRRGSIEPVTTRRAGRATRSFPETIPPSICTRMPRISHTSRRASGGIVASLPRARSASAARSLIC